MKDLFCFIVLLFYLTACSDSNRTLESELVNITDITYFEDESFQMYMFYIQLFLMTL